jgi:hypothetical protein
MEEIVGYATAFSFSKAFLAHTGTRPSTYRPPTVRSTSRALTQQRLLEQGGGVLNVGNGGMDMDSWG